VQQQGGPQFNPLGAEWAQPLAQQFGQPFAQPQAQPFAQPQPQTYVQPYTLPFAQPQAQPFVQPQPQPQAPPVAPVTCPVAPTGTTSAAQQGPQQQFARHLTGIARTLEQAIPGHQILVSLLQDLAASPRGQAVSGLSALTDLMAQSTFIHYGTLGAIRRFLCGEATPDVLALLAAGVNQLISLHSQTRPLWERAVMSASPELRSTFSNLNQVVTGTETLLSQAANAVQTAVGPQIWAAAQARTAGATAPAAGTGQ